jgi:FkbH-like protein
MTPDSNKVVGMFRLLDDLAALGAKLELDGDKILCKVTEKRIPDHVAKSIRQLKPSLLLYLRRAAKHSAMPKFEFGGDKSNSPLSSAQARIYFHEQLYKSSDFYVMPIALQLRGEIDVVKLKLAWHATCQRHSLLRSVISISNGIEINELADVFNPLKLQKWDELNTVEGGGILGRMLASATPSLRAKAGERLATASLYRAAERHHLLLINLHHIIADGWSVGVLFQDLLEAYFSAQTALIQSPTGVRATFADYVRWQGAYLASSVFTEDIAYWTDRMSDAPRSLDPDINETILARNKDVAANTRIKRIEKTWNHEGYKAITSWALQNGGTLHSTLLAAWYCLLHFWTDRDDIVVGTVVAGRPHPNFDEVVGCFINTLPVRQRVSPGKSFAEIHKAVHRNLLEAYEHQNCPIEEIVASVNPQREKDRNPLFNVGFLLQSYPIPTAPLGIDIKVIQVRSDHGSLDLRLIAGLINEEFVLCLEYNPNWLDEAGASLFIDSYLHLCSRLINDTSSPIVDFRRGTDLSELQIRRRAVVGATFTAEPLREAFEFWRSSLNIPFSLKFAAYDQIVQEMLDPISDMRKHSDHNCIFLRLEDWFPSLDVADQTLFQKISLFLDACVTYEKVSYVPMTIWVCPNTAKSLASVETREYLIKAEKMLVNGLKDSSRIHLRVAADSQVKYDLRGGDNEFGVRIGHIPYLPKVYAGLGTLMARELSAWHRPAIKAVVLDADNTLWKGVCGEDGIKNLEFDYAAIELQRFFSNMRKSGVALCLCSKNVEVDVRSVFDSRDESLLQWSDFSSVRVNWNLKSQNVEQIARELNIGLDSIAFIDDNPAECAEVESRFPQILCLPLPNERHEIPAFLNSVWELDVVNVSQVAGLRLSTYASNSAREELKKGSVDVKEYLQALAVQTTLRTMTVSDLERASELTRRTTQFNFSGRKRSPSDLAMFMATQSNRGYVVEVKDRFGSYGLTGVLLCSYETENCIVDTFLLSCRVLGKGVELAAFQQFECFMRDSSCSGIEVDFVGTERNHPARNFALSFFQSHAVGGEQAFVFKKNLR